MNVITSSEFRSNQRKYFDLAEKEPVVVTRAGKRPIALTPVDLKVSFLEEAERQIAEGKFKKFETAEEAISYFKSLE